MDHPRHRSPARARCGKRPEVACPRLGHGRGVGDLAGPEDGPADAWAVADVWALKYSDSEHDDGGATGGTNGDQAHMGVYVNGEPSTARTSWYGIVAVTGTMARRGRLRNRRTDAGAFRRRHATEPKRGVRPGREGAQVCGFGCPVRLRSHPPQRPGRQGARAQPAQYRQQLLRGWHFRYLPRRRVRRPRRVSTLDGTNFAPRKTVRVDATVWAWTTPSADKLELYYAANAGSPSWTLIAILTPTLVGPQTLSATYTLPSGTLQAVRARFRYQGTAQACLAGRYNDHDDLVFAVR